MNSRPTFRLFKQSLVFFTALFLLASCATRMRIPEDLEPERLLPTGAMAYLHVTPAKADELILPLMETYGMAQTEDLMKRTESMVLAVMPVTTSTTSDSARPAVFVVASGNFPTRTLALKMNIDRQWKKENPGWIHKEEGYRLAISSQGQILLGTSSLETFMTMDHGRPHPVPYIWRPAWDNDLAVYIPEPLSTQGMARSLPFDLSGMPLESMFMSMRRIDTNFETSIESTGNSHNNRGIHPEYDVFLGFEFDTERTALVFAPLCRLFLYAMARSLWPTQATEILAPVTWSTQGLTVEALGLRLAGPQVTSLLAMPLGETPGAPYGLSGGSR